MSAVSMMSFTPIGSPCSGPRTGPASSTCACPRARSGSRNAQAWIADSRAPIRTRQSSSTSIARTSRARSRAASAAAGRRFRSAMGLSLPWAGPFRSRKADVRRRARPAPRWGGRGRAVAYHARGALPISARRVTNAAILGVSGLLLIAYLLDIVGRKLKVPTVVLLIAAGMALREGLDLMNVHLRWVDPVVPIIGTLGLILIVLDGALDLRIRRERAHLVGVASAAALGGFLVCTVLFAALFRYALGLDTFPAVLMAFTFAVISSSVAIPSAAALPESSREFVVYESSLSDILGVLARAARPDPGPRPVHAAARGLDLPVCRGQSTPSLAAHHRSRR